MLDDYLDALTDQPEWQLVLHHYLQEEEAARQEASARRPKRGRTSNAAESEPVASGGGPANGTAGIDESTQLSVSDEHDDTSTPAVDFTDSDIDSENNSDDAGIGWSERVRELAGVPTGRLVPIHGKLIALGHLNYLLQGRTAGILYKVSTSAKRLLQKCPLSHAELLAQLAPPSSEDSVAA